MFEYTIRRLFQMLFFLIIISFIIFLALNLTGVDPVVYSSGVDSYDPETVALIREKYGLNDPLVIRYFHWIMQIVHGDLGYSLVTGQAIRDLLGNRFIATFELALLALICSSVLGIIIGVLSAIWQNSIIDYFGRVIAVIGHSLPSYFIGICLLQVFAIQLKWFPTGGRISIGDVTFADRFDHMVLPLITMTISMFAALTRFTRNSMLDVVTKDYVKTARSKGIPEWKVYIKHVFRNGMRPVMIVIVMRLGMLIGGSVAIESVFNWPGLGSSLTRAITSGDYPVVMIITLMIAAVMLVASFLVDIVTALLDPRVRFGK